MTTTTSHRGYLKASGGEHVDISVIDAALDAIDTDVYNEINARTAADALAAQKANNLSDLANATTARTNLGLGSAATQPSSAFDAAGAAAAVTATSIGAVAKGDFGLNVKDYGAKGDGTTNDTPALAALRDSAGVGGSLYFPSGTYVVDGLDASVANQTWTLHPSATLKLKTSASTLYAIKVTSNGITIKGGTLDGNRTGITGGNPFQIRGAADVNIEGITVKETYGYGININASLRVNVSNCRIINCLSGAVWIQASANTAVTNGGCTAVSFTRNLIDQTAVGTLTAGGITSFGDSSISNRRNTDITIANNVIRVPTPTSATATGSVGILYTDNATVANNQCDGGEIGISIAGTATYTSVTGNFIRNCYSYGLEFAGATDCAASGNVIDCTGLTSFGVAFNNAASRNVLTGNTVTRAGATGISAVQITGSTAIDNVVNGNVLQYTGAAATNGGVVVVNGASRTQVSGNTILGSGTMGYGVRLLNTPGEAAISGNMFRDLTGPAVMADATSATTVDYITVSGNTTKNCSALFGVTGSATLGANVQITGAPSGRTVTAATTLTSADRTVIFNSSSPISQALPTASSVPAFKELNLINTGTGLVTITSTLSGVTNQTLAQYATFVVTTDGTNWYLV